jgi:hypothetical protein
MAINLPPPVSGNLALKPGAPPPTAPAPGPRAVVRPEAPRH